MLLGLFTKHLPALARAWYPRAAGIVAVSDGVADDLAHTAGIPRERIATIHNPLDVARIRALAAEAPPEPWLESEGAAPVILGVGRLTAAKDFVTLLRAFARVRAERDARLVILGDGPQRLRLALEARRLEARAARAPHPSARGAGGGVVETGQLAEYGSRTGGVALDGRLPLVFRDCGGNMRSSRSLPESESCISTPNLLLPEKSRRRRMWALNFLA